VRLTKRPKINLNIINFTAFVGFLLTLFINSFSLYGQERFGIGLDFSLAQPQADFRKNLETIPIGGGITLAYRVPRSSWVFGFSFGYLEYGRERRPELLSPNIPELIVDVVTTYSILLGHAFIRYSPLKGMVQPYLEGLIGFNYLETETSLEDSYDSYGYYSGIRAKNASDWASSLGLGAGVACRILTIRPHHPSRPIYLMADAAARYLKGSRAQYLREGSIERKEGTAFYHFCYSRTDLIHISISLFLWF
jgi:hypothetical protein